MFQAFDNNIDNIFIQVRSRGDALYNSNIVKINSNVEKGFDPLEYSLMLGNLLNIKIHAWINTYLIWSAPYPPDDKSHIYYSNPEWFESNLNGISDHNLIIEGEIADEGLYLSPNHPSVNKYIFKVVKELIENYPTIHGIHFDYIRFQDNNYGFNKIGVYQFEKIFKFNPKDIINNYQNKNSNEFIIDSLYSLWINYSCSNITDLLKSINQYLILIDSDIMISAAVKTNPIEAKNRWYQDWNKWIRDDLLDFVIPMNYTTDNSTFIDNLRKIKSIIPFNDKIIIGIALHNQNESGIAQKIIFSKYCGYTRICLFSYNSIRNNSIDLSLIKYEYLKNKYMIED